MLGIAIHVNGPAYRIPVRLRWRLQEGKVSSGTRSCGRTVSSKTR